MHQLLDTFKALADETRLRIISLLISEGELCVCHIIRVLQLPQSTVSRHLAYLRKTGWVSDRRCGIWIYYSLNHERSAVDNGLIEFLRGRLEALGVVASDRERLKISKGTATAPDK